MRRWAPIFACLVFAAACDDGGSPSRMTGPPVLPQTEACDAVRDWNPELVDLELAMLDAIDARRSEGRTCGPRGSFDPAPPLRLRGALTCAARVHALDMAREGFVDQFGSDDSTPWDRLRAVDYAFATADQTVVATDLPPEDILDELWLPREGSCSALSATAYTEVGIGVALPFDPEDLLEGRRWTVVLAKPIE